MMVLCACPVDDMGVSSQGSETGECTPGTSGCPCDDDRCGDGLVCASSICTPTDDTDTDVVTSTIAPTSDSSTSEDTSSTTDGEDTTVGCDCPAEMPICDESTGRCSGCNSHAQCPKSACDLWDSVCFDVDATLWVKPGDSCDDAGTATETEPLCSLGRAFDILSVTPGVPRAIRAWPHSRIHETKVPLVVPEKTRVALVHASLVDSAKPVVSGGPTTILQLENGADLIVDRVSLQDAKYAGIDCRAGRLWADRTTVSKTAGHGVLADRCTVILRRSLLVGNTLSGMLLNEGEGSVENSFISFNGTNPAAFGGIHLMRGARLTLSYSTMVDNHAGSNLESSVSCDKTDGDKENVSVSDSAILGGGTQSVCPGATVVTSAWSTVAPGDGNVALALDDLALVLSADPLSWGVFRGRLGFALDGLAKREVGDPAVDFFGQTRVVVGEHDMAGAALPK